MKQFFLRHFSIFLILFILLVVLGGYFYKNNISYTNPDLVVENEIRDLIEEVGNLMVLPTNEVPTIATVSDPAVLKNQIFFSEAKRGDKVLIYTNAKKAILYDPVIKKIINIAPVNLGDVGRSEESLPSSITLPSETENQF